MQINGMESPKTVDDKVVTVLGIDESSNGIINDEQQNQTENVTEKNKNEAPGPDRPNNQNFMKRSLFEFGRSSSKKDVLKRNPALTACRRGSTNTMAITAIKAAAMAMASQGRAMSEDTTKGHSADTTERMESFVMDSGGRAAFEDTTTGHGTSVGKSSPGGRVRRRRMRRKSLSALKSLVSFVRTNSNEHMNLLQIAMTAAEVCALLSLAYGVRFPVCCVIIVHYIVEADKKSTALSM